jgi:hypothetical protein
MARLTKWPVLITVMIELINQLLQPLQLLNP